jgi:EAL domain-containing protein (putative c-di-GMP-specific phosphodiesterase class I)
VASVVMDRLRDVVLADDALQDELLATPDPARFAQRLTDLADSLGLTLTVEEVQAELKAARQLWLQRWV